MGLSSIQKGNIIEAQIANILILISDGELSPFIPIVDDNGIDLILTKKGTFSAIFLQVKSRFVTNNRNENRLDFQIDKEKFKVSKCFFVLCVYFNQEMGSIEQMWLIPSEEIINHAVELERFFRIVASKNKNSKDKWSKFKVTQQELISQMESIL